MGDQAKEGIEGPTEGKRREGIWGGGSKRRRGRGTKGSRVGGTRGTRGGGGGEAEGEGTNGKG